jgi:hypothetical protein
MIKWFYIEQLGCNSSPSAVGRVERVVDGDVLRKRGLKARKSLAQGNALWQVWYSPEAPTGRNQYFLNKYNVEYDERYLWE